VILARIRIRAAVVLYPEPLGPALEGLSLVERVQFTQESETVDINRSALLIGILNLLDDIRHDEESAYDRVGHIRYLVYHVADKKGKLDTHARTRAAAYRADDHNADGLMYGASDVTTYLGDGVFDLLESSGGFACESAETGDGAYLPGAFDKVLAVQQGVIGEPVLKPLVPPEVVADRHVLAGLDVGDIGLIKF